MESSMFSDHIWLDKLKLTLVSWNRNVLEAPNSSFSARLLSSLQHYCIHSVKTSCVFKD